MRQLSAARALFEARVPHSARALLDHLQESTGYHSPEASRLARSIQKALASRPPLPAASALTVVDEACGIVLPLACEHRTATPDYLGDRARQAAANALSLARAAVGLTEQLELRLILRHQIPVEGESLGLAAAICFIARLSGKAPRRPVLATGELNAVGLVQPIRFAEKKLEAAEREIAGREALVLAHPADAAKAPPTLAVCAVETLAEAAQAAFDGPLEVAAEFVRLDALLREVEPKNPRDALERLEAVEASFPAPADQAALLARRGTLNRHLGRTAEAKELHDKALALAESIGPLLGKKLVEDLRVEAIATELDLFELDSAEAALEQMLAGQDDFADFHNVVRCRGMLAQIASMRGDYRRALTLRRDNLRVQDVRDALRAEIPRTLCPMILDAAKAGEAGAFEDLAGKLLHQPRPDSQQARYNTDALLRGLVVLGRFEEALRWSRGECDLHGQPACDAQRALLRGEEPIVDHPEVSIARALIRALRRTGEHDKALQLARRVSPQDRNALIAWLGCVAHAEAALARWQLGHRAEALAELTELASHMEKLHPQASRFYALLLGEMRCLGARADESTLERCIDGLYY